MVSSTRMGCQSLGEPHRGIAEQLCASIRENLRWRFSILTEEAMRQARKSISRLARIHDQNAPARSRQLQRGGQTREAAANNDDVVPHESLPI